MSGKRKDCMPRYAHLLWCWGERQGPFWCINCGMTEAEIDAKAKKGTGNVGSLEDRSAVKA